VVWLTEWALAALAFRLAYGVAAEPRGRQWLIRLYLVSAGIFGMDALWVFLTTSYPRLTGSFFWPNPAAAYLLPALVTSFDRLRQARGRKALAWLGACTGFVATFLLTDSRAALIIIVFILLLYLLIASLKGFWIKFLLVLVLGFGLSVGLAALSTRTAHHSWSLIPGSRLAQVASGEPASLTDRVDYVKSAFEIWWLHPILGTGAGTYADVHPRFQQGAETASSDAHNLYAQVLSELGLVGALALAATLLWLFAGCLRGLLRNPELIPVALGMAALLLHFAVDIDASYPALLLLAAVLAGLLYAQWWPQRGRSSWYPAGLAAVVMVPVISLYQSGVWAAVGQAAQDNNNYAQAVSDYAAAHRGVAYDPDYVDAEGIDWYTLAAVGANGARADAQLALERARTAEKLDPDDGQHYQLEGRVLALTGNLKGAAAAFTTALKLDPYDHPEYALELATVQLDEGERARALATANAMLTKYPPAVVVNRNLDTSIRPTLSDLDAFVGNLELQGGNLPVARQAAGRALQQDPADLRARALEVQVGERAIR